MIMASRQAFPCEAERPEDALLVVRHSVGLSTSLLNRAVYDRCYDWVLSVDHPSEVKIVPEGSSSSGNTFKLSVKGYNSYSQYFRERDRDLVSSYQKVVRVVRDQIGEESFLLGCWGIRPELIGIIDGCRIGTDGFGYGGLAQYNSFNNVIWRNDPDHIELSDEEAYRSTMVTSLTGSLYMLTDKPEIYRTEKAEPAKRTVPVLFTLPGQIFDIDPSRSGLLSRIDSEVSGSGPRVFDGEQAPRCSLYLMEMNTPFESWMLLGRIDSDIKRISFDDLGLSPDKEYFIFEFWSKKLLGRFTEEFSPGRIDPKYNCQLFCIRERKDYPQIIATNRHISCGYELSKVGWKGSTLSGASEVVGRDGYTLYIAEPEGYVFKEFSCTGAEKENIQKKGILRIIELRSGENTSVQWSLEYEKK